LNAATRKVTFGPDPRWSGSYRALPPGPECWAGPGVLFCGLTPDRTKWVAHWYIHVYIPIMRRPVSIAAAKHLLGKLEKYREEAAARFPDASSYSRADRESFVLAMLEGYLQYHADPTGKK